MRQGEISAQQPHRALWDLLPRKIKERHGAGGSSLGQEAAPNYGAPGEGLPPALPIRDRPARNSSGGGNIEEEGAEEGRKG